MLKCLILKSISVVNIDWFPGPELFKKKIQNGRIPKCTKYKQIFNALSWKRSIRRDIQAESQPDDGYCFSMKLLLMGESCWEYWIYIGKHIYHCYYSKVWVDCEDEGGKIRCWISIPNVMSLWMWLCWYYLCSSDCKNAIMLATGYLSNVDATGYPYRNTQRHTLWIFPDLYTRSHNGWTTWKHVLTVSEPTASFLSVHIFSLSLYPFRPDMTVKKLNDTAQTVIPMQMVLSNRSMSLPSSILIMMIMMMPQMNRTWSANYIG